MYVHCFVDLNFVNRNLIFKYRSLVFKKAIIDYNLNILSRKYYFLLSLKKNRYSKVIFYHIFPLKNVFSILR